MKTTKSEITRNQILLVAREQFALKGYHNTKISDIVNAANVSQGTFYWHFKSKEAIVLEILEIGEQHLLEVIHKGYRKEAGTTDEMIRGSHRLLMDIFRFALEHRYFMELLLLLNNENQNMQIRCKEIRYQVESAFKENIERAVALNMLPDTMDVELRASFLTSLIEGTIVRWLFPQNSLEQEEQKTVEQLADELVKFEFYGLFAK